MSGLDGPAEAYDLELATVSLLADGKDLRILLTVLSKQLSDAFGDRMKVERKGGLLHRSDEIRSIAVTIGNEHFVVDVNGGGVACSVGHESGGIRIRSEHVEMDEWLRRLLGALKVEAVHSQSARSALENIVIGGSA